MTAHEVDGIRDSLELLIDALQEKHHAAVTRSARTASTPAALEQLSLLSGAVGAAKGLWSAVVEGHPEQGSQLDTLIAHAAALDVKFPDGGPLLSSEHQATRQMTRLLVQHFFGEFSFPFAVGQGDAEIRARLARTMNHACGFFFDDWSKLPETDTELELALRRAAEALEGVEQ